MTGILDAGFIFWGLFLAFGVIVVAYLLWMRWEERRGPPPTGSGAGEEPRRLPPSGRDPGEEPRGLPPEGRDPGEEAT